LFYGARQHIYTVQHTRARPRHRNRHCDSWRLARQVRRDSQGLTMRR
jgi:hypothetical protein